MERGIYVREHSHADTVASGLGFSDLVSGHLL